MFFYENLSCRSHAKAAEVVGARVEAGSLRSMDSLVSPPRDGGGRGFVRKWGSVAVARGEYGGLCAWCQSKESRSFLYER